MKFKPGDVIVRWYGGKSTMKFTVKRIEHFSPGHYRYHLRSHLAKKTLTFNTARIDRNYELCETFLKAREFKEGMETILRE